MKESIKLKYKIVVIDKDGNVVLEMEEESKSWLKNFGHFLAIILGNKTTLGVTNINGVYQTMFSGSGVGYSEVWTEGCKVVDGTGTTPVSPNDYALASMVGEALASVSDPVVSGPVTQFTISGGISHNTSVTIGEIGIVWMYKHPSLGDVSVLLVRDVLPSPAPVSAGSTFRIEYTVQVIA